jgi:hypothetical protein
MPRKRTGQIYELLTPEQREEVRQWLAEDGEGLGYVAAAERIFEKWGVKLDKNALWRFFNHKEKDRLVEKLFKTASFANELIHGAEEVRDPFSALGKVIGAAALTQAAGEEVDWKTIGVMVQSAVAARKQLSTEHGLALDTARFQREFCDGFLKWWNNQRAAEIAGGTASNTEKIEQLGQLMFGDDWKPATP